MKTTRIDRIEISKERQRKNFDEGKLMELMESIQSHGLLQPVVLRELEGNRLELAAGERRLRALKMLWELGGALRHNGASFGEGVVPYISVDALDPIAAMEVELDENLRRENLTWQEEADALRKLQKLRTAQNPKQTVADLALEVKGRKDGYFHDEVRTSLIVADYLDDPEVAAAKTAKDAFKILKKKEERKQNEERAAAVGKTFNANVHELYNIDCVRWLQGNFIHGEVEKFTVLLTDPPYGMGADKFGDAAGALVGATHDYEDSHENWIKLMEDWVPAVTNMMKPQAHAYVFCDFERFAELRNLFLEEGWEVHRTPLIWTKPTAQRVPWPDYGPRRHWEMILYAVRGKKPTTAIYPDVIEAAADANLGHAAQKPVALYENLLRRSVRAGDRVIDCFAATGTIFPAAHSYKCAAVGLELSSASYGIAAKRLEDLETQLEFGL